MESDLLYVPESIGRLGIYMFWKLLEMLAFHDF